MFYYPAASDNAENDDFDCNSEDCLNVAIEKIDDPKFIKICDCGQLSNHPRLLFKKRKSSDETSFKKLKNTLSIIEKSYFHLKIQINFRNTKPFIILYDNIKDFKMKGNFKKRTLKNNH